MTSRYCLTRFFWFALVSIFAGSALAADPHADQSRHAFRYDQRHNRLVYGGVPYFIYSDAVKKNRQADFQKTLFARDLGTGSIKKFFELPQGKIRDFQVSPSGNVIAVTTSTSPRYERVTLRLLKDSGGNLDSIEQVRDYAFSPSGNQLVYTTGEYQGLYEGIQSTGTWIYDVQRKERRKILDSGRYVAWAGFDGNVYIYDIRDFYNSKQDRVRRYDAVTSQVEITSHKGIYFSPTGAYYFMPYVGRGRFEVYETETDAPLSVRLSEMLGKFHPKPVGWLPQADDLLLFTTAYDLETGSEAGTTRSMVYNPRSDEVTDLGPQGFLGSDGTQVILYDKEDRVQKKSVSELMRR